MLKKIIFAAAALTLVGGVLAAPSANAADTARPTLFALTSPAMKSYTYMPDKYIGTNPQNHNCSGGNVSLPLSWKNAPDGTKSFAITMYDPAARGGAGFVHWVAYDIPGDKKGLKEGEANSTTGFVGGKNGAGEGTWRGPCAPLVDYPHPYIITLVATDIAPGTLKPGLTRDELGAALQGHALAITTFIAREAKPAKGS
jgi:Raf kinase inhibitor-like YbhB/YbcL family protein